MGEQVALVADLAVGCGHYPQQILLGPKVATADLNQVLLPHPCSLFPLPLLHLHCHPKQPETGWDEIAVL